MFFYWVGMAVSLSTATRAPPVQHPHLGGPGQVVHPHALARRRLPPAHAHDGHNTLALKGSGDSLLDTAVRLLSKPWCSAAWAGALHAPQHIWHGPRQANPLRLPCLMKNP